MNEFIQPDITEPRYNKLDYSSWFTSRLLGTKRFELTDHLGNVSSVILDRKTPVNTGSVLHKYDPDVQLVLDYYPYGMVMKEGYCDTCDPNAVTQSTGPALKMVNTDYTLLPQNYPPLTGTTVANWMVVTGGEAEPQEEGQLSWEGTGGGMLFTCLNEVNPGTHELGLTALMEVTAEEAYEIEIVVDIDDAGELEAKIISYTDPEHTEYDVLTSTEIPTSTGYLLQFTPTTDTVWLWIGRKAEHGFVTGTKFKVTGTTTAKTTWTVYQMNIQGLLHSWRSPYRFAYNGQERVDDIKGKTNHNTALYGEYDTRRAWRWNRDPKPVDGISSYAMFQGNPIRYSDILLDSIGIRGFKQAKIIKSLDRGLLVDKDKSPYSFNKAGKLIVDEDKYNALTDKQKEIASPIRELARSDMDVEIVKAGWRDVIPFSGGKTLGYYGGGATVANLDASGNQDMTGSSGVTILWTGKGESFSPSNGAPMIYQTDATAIHHEIGHAFFRFLKQNPKQAGKTIDYENKVRKQSNEMLQKYQHREYNAEHPDPNEP